MKNYPSIRYSSQVDHSFPNQLDTLQATPFLQSNGPMKGMSAAEVTVPHSVRRLHAAEGLPEKLLAARQKYEVALPAPDLALHLQNQTRVADAVLSFKANLVQQNPGISPEAVRLHIEENISQVIEAAKLDLIPYRVKGKGTHDYGKYLMYTDDNRGAPFCFQFFRFDAHQKTPIHDHPCACTSLVIFGQVRERTYEMVAEQLQKVKKEDRDAGSSRTIDLETNHPHSIKNGGGAPAGTLHVYRIDGVEKVAAVRTVFCAAGIAEKALKFELKKEQQQCFLPVIAKIGVAATYGGAD